MAKKYVLDLFNSNAAIAPPIFIVLTSGCCQLDCFPTSLQFFEASAIVDCESSTEGLQKSVTKNRPKGARKCKNSTFSCKVLLSSGVPRKIPPGSVRVLWTDKGSPTSLSLCAGQLSFKAPPKIPHSRDANEKNHPDSQNPS